MIWLTVRLQVFEKCAMNAAAEVPLELCDPNSAIRAFIGQRNEPAPLLFFHGHFRQAQHVRGGVLGIARADAGEGEAVKARRGRVNSQKL